MEIVWKFLKKLKTELSYDPAISLPGICLEKTVIQKDVYTPMFTAVLLTIAKTSTPPTYPSAEQMKKVWHTYTALQVDSLLSEPTGKPTKEYYSAIKKE